MSIESMTWALNLADERLTPTQKLVLIGIANHEGDGGSWPKMETLARYAGVTVRQARKCVAVLVECGLVEVEEQAGGTTKMPDHLRPNLYRTISTGRSSMTSPPGPVGPPPPVTGDPPEPSVEPYVEPTPPTPNWFDVFWKIYPRSDGRPAAVRAWGKAVSKATPETIIAGLDRWNAYWARNDPRFIPWAQKWLNQEQWNATPPRPGGRTMSILDRLHDGEL